MRIIGRGARPPGQKHGCSQPCLGWRSASAFSWRFRRSRLRRQPARARSLRPRQTPTVAADSDTAAVELGVKFRADQDGFVTGIRFYKGTGNTGTHTGSLWSSTRHAAGHGDLHRRDRDRLAAGELRVPSRRYREHHLCRLLLRTQWTLLGRRRLLCELRRQRTRH